MSYLNSKRKQLKDRLTKIQKEYNLGITEISVSIGKSKNYLSATACESAFRCGGDISDNRSKEINSLLDGKYKNKSLEKTNDVKIENIIIKVQEKLNELSFEDKIILEAARIILSRR